MVSWEADQDGIRIIRRRRIMLLRWQEISRAGLVSFSPPNLPPDFPAQAMPGLNRVFDLNQRLAGQYAQLVLARGKSVFRAVRVPIPADQPAAAALVDEVCLHLAGRWIGRVPMEKQRQALGLSNPWWYYPVLIAGLAVFGLIVLLAAGAFEALATGSLADVPLIAWLALLGWLVIVGAILFLYRRWA